MGREERREGFNTKVAKGTEDTKKGEEKNISQRSQRERRAQRRKNRPEAGAA